MSVKTSPNTDNADPARPARKKDRYNRFAWRDAVFADPKTPTNAKCLAYGIATFVNGGTGEAKVSTPKLAAGARLHGSGTRSRCCTTPDGR
jgi:hypothetical protein